MIKVLIIFGLFLFWGHAEAKNRWQSSELPRELANERDPFDSIDEVDLDNGLKIFFAPSNEALHTSIRVEVHVGWDIEDSTNFGAAHLLEHVLFRDKQLQDEMSYLQLIKEAGGEANGQTEAKWTSYYGTINADKGPWLLEQFSKMLLSPSISADYVSKEKATVELERGRPSPIAEILGRDIKDLYPKYLRARTFWESEFKVSFDPQYTLAEEQLSTRRLSVEQVRSIYENFYYPSNMRVFVAGKYKRSEIMKALEPWTKLAKRDGKKMPPNPEAVPREKPFMFATVTTGSPYLYLGTKIWNVSLQDFYVLDSYVEYVAHRLMKEVRNKKGQTYSAQAKTYTYDRYGYSYINFETTKENFQENYKLALEYIQKEAQTGSISEEQMNAAITLYLNRYRQIGRDSRDMLYLSQMVSDTMTEFENFQSPYKVLADISPENYNYTLKKYYAPERRYQYLYQPPMFFHYDLYLMYVVTYFLSFLVARKILSRKFKHAEIKWVRKVKYPPLKVLEAVALFCAVIVFWHVYFLAQRVVLSSALMQSNVLFSQYLFDAFQIVAFVACIQLFLSHLPKKLMVVGNNLIIKSVSYYSKEIPLNDIAWVETVSAMSFPFPLTSWLVAIGPRFFFVNPLFWQKGLLIHLKNGKGYFFSMSDAVEAKKELRRLLPTPTDEGAKFPLTKTA